VQSSTNAVTSVLAQISELAAILYDLDGTIAHTDPVHFQAWAEALQPFDIAIDEPFYKQRITGKLNPAIVADLLPQLTVAEGVALAEQKEARFRELATQLPAMTGLQDVIAWASAHQLKQAVVTNAPRANVQFMLEILKLDQTFDRVILSEELGAGKPDPAPYQFALEAFGLNASAAIAFEDSPSGVRSAVAAQIPTVGIASSQTPTELYAVGASLVVPDFAAPSLWEVLNAAPIQKLL
jgi:HAD superfamily hydrolase (TIGR01509 family)